jgi:hypothetical protein
MVAVHNDYRLRGETFTFYLFTHKSGLWAKGEGRSDLEAIEDAQVQMALHPPIVREYRAALGRVIDNLAVTRRWPCPDCGRESDTAPLRLVKSVPVALDQETPIGYVVITGCWRCNAESVLRGAIAAFQRDPHGT